MLEGARYYEELSKLLDQRKIFIGLNSQLKKAYEQHTDISAVGFYSLIKIAEKNNITISIDEKIPVFTDGVNPGELDGLFGTALITDSDCLDFEWYQLAIKPSDKLGYRVTKSLGIFMESPTTKRFEKGTPCSVIENHFMSLFRWSTRVTIIDGYMLNQNKNRNGLWRFLDSLEKYCPNLTHLRLVLGQHCTTKEITTNSGHKISFEQVKTSNRGELRGSGAKEVFETILRETILHHPIFNRILKISIAWLGGNHRSTRYLSFGNSTNDITYKFDKGAGYQFNVTEGDFLEDDIELTAPFDKQQSKDTMSGLEFEDLEFRG